MVDPYLLPEKHGRTVDRRGKLGTATCDHSKAKQSWFEDGFISPVPQHIKNALAGRSLLSNDAAVRHVVAASLRQQMRTSGRGSESTRSTGPSKQKAEPGAGLDQVRDVK